jgi:enoyl-CoA hydratase/carnithine racemase
MPSPRSPPTLPTSYNSLPWTQIKTQHYEKDPCIIILTLWRPQNHNAFTNTMMLEIEEAYAMFNVDDRVKCIVFTGGFEGKEGKIFCAGADLEVGFVGGKEKVNEHRDGYVPCFCILFPCFSTHKTR